MCGVNFHVISCIISLVWDFCIFVQRSFIICVFRVFIMRAEPEDSFVFSSACLLILLHFGVRRYGRTVDWCLLFGEFRKVQARSSWFGYKTDIISFSFFSFGLAFSSVLFAFLGTGYCGVGVGLFARIHCVVCCLGISFCCWVSKFVISVCFWFCMCFRGDFLCCKN